MIKMFEWIPWEWLRVVGWTVVSVGWLVVIYTVVKAVVLLHHLHRLNKDLEEGGE